MNAHLLEPAAPQAPATRLWIVFVAAVGIAAAFVGFAALPDREAPVTPRHTGTPPKFSKALVLRRINKLTYAARLRYYARHASGTSH
jgi:hypothetical protein